MIDRPLRSVLFLPAANSRAIDKARGLPCDAVVLDLEDAVGPDAKDAARALAIDAVRQGAFGERTAAIRVNALDTRWGAQDLAAVRTLEAPLTVVPKAGSAADVHDYASAMPEGATLWAMVETALGVLHLPELSAAGRGLCGLVLGTNDLSRDLRRPAGQDRRSLHYAMSAVVTAARAHGLAALDGVFNRLNDPEGFAVEAAEGRAFGFDGKCLIHPGQVEAANVAFAPSASELVWARSVIAAFAEASSDRGALRVDGAMVERLHLSEAERLLASAPHDANVIAS